VSGIVFVEPKISAKYLEALGKWGVGEMERWSTGAKNNKLQCFSARKRRRSYKWL